MHGDRMCVKSTKTSQVSKKTKISPLAGYIVSKQSWAYSTVLMKVYFTHRARNAFEREPSEREGPNFSKASSIEQDLQFSIYSVEYTEIYGSMQV